MTRMTPEELVAQVRDNNDPPVDQYGNTIETRGERFLFHASRIFWTLVLGAVASAMASTALGWLHAHGALSDVLVCAVGIAVGIATWRGGHR